MSLSDKETAQMKERAWRKRAKGHPTRWRMLRDAVAVLSLKWMNISEFQTAMRRLWALKNKTSRDMLEELEQERAVTQERDVDDQIYKWGATREGVAFWIRHVSAIPAGIVEVVLTSTSVLESEESKNEIS